MNPAQKYRLACTLSVLTGLAMLLQFSAKSFVYVHFLINQEEIAKTECVQRAIPGNCCQGSCVLEKDLNTNGATEDFPFSLIRKLNDVESFVQVDSIQKAFYPNELKPNPHSRSFLRALIWAEEISKPPTYLL
ncbi:MAG: hypothetical protein ACK500_06655 [Flavobacteriales bacterium]